MRSLDTRSGTLSEEMCLKSAYLRSPSACFVPFPSVLFFFFFPSSSQVGPGTGKVRTLLSEVSAECLEQIAGSLGGSPHSRLTEDKDKTGCLIGSK